MTRRAPTPAIVTQAAARRLPRWVLVLLGLCYIIPGFLGREPWRNHDLASFGVMLELAHNPQQWWQPQLLGEPALIVGWLPYWLGALFIQALPILPADQAAKLPFAGLLLLTLVSTWYAAYHLARLPGAQPVAFAFGGEAHPVDYARATADAAFLALIASLGLALLAHETSVEAARLAFVALALHAAARSLNPNVRSGRLTLILWWLSAWGLALSGAPWLTLWLGLMTVLAHVFMRQLRSRLSLATTASGPGSAPTFRGLIALGFAGSVLAAAVVAWFGDLFPVLSTWNLAHWLALGAWESWARLLIWFTWPAGLLALWALWTWRRQWRCAHWLLPVAWGGSVMLMTWVQGGSDRNLLLALPALACLAAFALPTMRRSVSAALDWFALLFFTGTAVVIWVIWLAMSTGIPAQPAANVAKLAPNFVASFQIELFAPALLLTLVWVAVTVWRIGGHRPAIWKSLVLSASGITLCWVLLMTLWLPLLNHGMGLAPISQRIAAITPAGSCVLVHGLHHAQITGLIYHGSLEVKRPGSSDAASCLRLVTDAADYASLPASVDMAQWRLLNRLPRLRDGRDVWLVFERRLD